MGRRDKEREEEWCSCYQTIRITRTLIRSCYRQGFADCGPSSKFAASWFSKIDGVLLQQSHLLVLRAELVQHITTDQLPETVIWTSNTWLERLVQDHPCRRTGGDFTTKYSIHLRLVASRSTGFLTSTCCRRPQMLSWKSGSTRCNSVFDPPRVNVHRRTNSRANLCTIRVFVPPAKMCT